MRTRVGPLACMIANMNYQPVFVTERFRAQLALEGPLLVMHRRHVALQVTFVDERTIALVTLETTFA